MWMDYGKRYIKENKATSIFLATISFIATTLLSLISGVFYNAWIDWVERRFLAGQTAPSQIKPAIAYAFVLLLASLALVSMIYHAYEVSMNDRMHQLGILQSVGATPSQIRTFLLQEAIVLGFFPVLLGIFMGILLSYGFMQLIIMITENVRKYDVFFRYHILVAIGALIFSMATILFSAWIPARRISKLTPLTAIHYGGEPPVKRMKKFHLISGIFGIEGELARKSLYARKKALRTSTISLMLSFLAFVSFLNFEAISGLSTSITYFERYKDKWDIKLVTTDLQEREEELTLSIRAMDGVRECITYKKFEATTTISQELLSEELLTVGVANLTDKIKGQEDGYYRIPVVVYILDNQSFQEYCSVQGIAQDTQAIMINKIWDSVHTDRLHRDYLPMLQESAFQPELTADTTDVQRTATVEVTAFTDEMPGFKEAFVDYYLSLVVSVQGASAMGIDIPYTESEYNIKYTSDEKEPLLMEAIAKQLDESDEYKLESRIQDEASDVSMRRGLRFITGAFAALLASIGLANVFSSTLGQVYQRRKEFARYMSVGLSPQKMKRLLLLEAIFVSLKPVLLGLLINIPLVLVTLDSSFISVSSFLSAAPIWPTVFFACFIVFFVGLAYYLGGRKIISEDIIELLKDETMI